MSLDSIYKLYAKPSLLEGLARLFDGRGRLNIYNYSDSMLKADWRATFSDWQQVGNDLALAMKEYEISNWDKLHG